MVHCNKALTTAMLPLYRPSDILASACALSNTIDRLHASHGGDPDVAALCTKWAGRVAELKQLASEGLALSRSRC